MMIRNWLHDLRRSIAAHSLLALFVGILGLRTSTATPPENQQQLAALLVERCLACHGPAKQEGGYRVDTFERLRKPGDSGERPIAPGKAKDSELFKRLTTDDADSRMPAGSPALSAQQIAIVQQWISEGAHIDPALESKSIATWSRQARKQSAPEHYPTALPVTALAATSAADGLAVWTSGYGEALQWKLSNDQGENDAALVTRTATNGLHVSDIDLSSDGKLLAISSGTPGTQGFVEIFAPSDDGLQQVWMQTCPDVPADLAFSPDAQNLAVAQSDGSLLIVAIRVDHPEQCSTRVLTPHADAILALNWSEKGNRLITGSRDRTAKIFDAAKWELIANYDRHERAVGGVAYIDRYPVSLDETGKLRLWSGDDNDRTLAERDNQARFLEHVVTGGQRIWYAMGGDLRSMEVERKTVDDGKDDAGKPKQKTTTRWISSEELKSKHAAWLLSIDIDKNFVAAGNELGEVIIWRTGEAEPWRRFMAKP